MKSIIYCVLVIMAISYTSCKEDQLDVSVIKSLDTEHMQELDQETIKTVVVSALSKMG